MSKWRRPVTKTYDYNFKLGEHYYKPQLEYLNGRKGRESSPPTAKTFAERFAEDPIYGRGSGPNYRKSGDGLGEGLGSARFGSLDDLSLRNKGSLFGQGENFDSKYAPSSPRLIVGDRLLDSVGIKESQLSSALNLSSINSSTSRAQRRSEDHDHQSILSRRKQLTFAQSADSELVSEDPFKTRVSSKLVAARKQADDMMEDMKRESEATVSRFRSRTQARREEQTQRREDQLQSVSSSGFGFSDDDAEAAAVRSRVNEIGLRAKARLAALEDNYPEIEIGSSLAARRAATNAASSYADDDSSSRQTSSRTVKITKRTVKASYELE